LLGPGGGGKDQRSISSFRKRKKGEKEGEIGGYLKGTVLMVSFGKKMGNT